MRRKTGAAVIMLLVIFFCLLLLYLEMDGISNGQSLMSQIFGWRVETQNGEFQMSDAPLPERIRLSAPFVSQRPELPNGCEVASLTMLLRSAGIDVDKMQLAEEIRKVPFSSGNEMGNPNEGFVGNMYHGDGSHPGYAVYHGPVADLAKKYLDARVIDFSGEQWQDVEKRLASGRPVWVITSINFRPVPESRWQIWHTDQGNIRITLMEHAVLVTGYDDKYVFFNDPLAKKEGSRADKRAFAQAWRQLGSQAITYK